MDCPCNQLFTSAGFTKDYNIGIGAGSFQDKFIDILHGKAFPNDIAELIALFYTGPEFYVFLSKIFSLLLHGLFPEHLFCDVPHGSKDSGPGLQPYNASVR